MEASKTKLDVGLHVVEVGKSHDHLSQPRRDKYTLEIDW